LWDAKNKQYYGGNESEVAAYVFTGQSEYNTEFDRVLSDRSPFKSEIWTGVYQKMYDFYDEGIDAVHDWSTLSDLSAETQTYLHDMTEE